MIGWQPTARLKAALVAEATRADRAEAEARMLRVERDAALDAAERCAQAAADELAVARARVRRAEVDAAIARDQALALTERLDTARAEVDWWTTHHGPCERARGLLLRGAV